MNSFKYSMQGILDIKHTLKTVSEINYSQANRLFEIEHDALERIKHKIREVTEDQSDSDANPLPSMLQQRDEYLKRLEELRENQEYIVKLAEDKVEGFRNDLIIAEQELKKVERLRHREYNKWSDQSRREEQAELDEINASLAYSL